MTTVMSCFAVAAQTLRPARITRTQPHAHRHACHVLGVAAPTGVDHTGMPCCGRFGCGRHLMTVRIDTEKAPDPLAARHADLVSEDNSHRSKDSLPELDSESESDVHEELKSALLETCPRVAEESTADAIARPRYARGDTAAQLIAFEARLEARWGRGLDLADLVADEAFESGRWVNELLRSANATDHDHRFEALIRLHGKAVMTSREVMVLLRSGYSSGALARWRTLHEVWVVFLILADSDEELSRRYLAHEIVESLKAQQEYEETWEALGEEAPDWSISERHEIRQELADEFGRTFLRDYGWAAPLFGDSPPKFRQLQEHAELDHWRGYYRMASHGTHANPKGVTWNIQELAPIDVVWAGPSDAGLADPAQCSLIALASLTVGLMAFALDCLPESEDDGLEEHAFALVRQQTILVLMEQAIDVLMEVDAQQEAEEEAMMSYGQGLRMRPG